MGGGKTVTIWKRSQFPEKDLNQSAGNNEALGLWENLGS
jgi:hypothetical protein